MTDITALSQEFNSLKSDNTPEWKKKLSQYISKLKSTITNENDAAVFFESLDPRTDIERLFQLEIAITLQRNDFILRTLKTGDAMSIRMILNCSKFLQTTFTKVKSEELVNDILPYLSYSTKLKLLNKLSTQVQQAELFEEFHGSLEKKYGNTLATLILPGCSNEFIKEKFKECNCKFTERQLFFVAKKNPDFLKDYMETAPKKEPESARIYTRILKYFANTNPEVFWAIQDKFHLDIELGRSQTTNVLKNNVEKLKVGEKYLKFLHHDIVYKTLRRHNLLKGFLMSFLPDDWNNVDVCLRKSHPLIKFIEKYFRNGKMWDILKSICEEKYSVDFFENIPEMDEDIVKMIMKNKTDSEKIMGYIAEQELVDLQTTDKAIPLLKEQISSDDSDEIPGIIKKMFENCALNDDKQALEEVLEFTFCRFKYDVHIFRELFGMITDWHYFSQFTPKMWTTLDKLFEMHKRPHLLMDNHLPFYFNHLIESGMSIQKYFKAVVACLHMTEIKDSPFRKKKYERIALEEFGNTLEPLSESNLFGYMCMKYTEWVVDYNDRNPTSKVLITKYSNIIKFFSSSLYAEAADILYHCLKQFDYEQFDAALWLNFNLRVKENILIWYARYHPEKLIENKEIIFTETDYKVEIFLMNLRRYPQHEVINVYKTHAINVLKDADNPQGPFAALFLSVFSQDDFCKIAQIMIPSPDGKMHYGTTYEKVTLQRAITRGLRNCDDNNEKLSLIKQYCRGYYVKYCFNVFYSMCANTSEVLLAPFLNELNDATIMKHVKGATKSYLFKYDIKIKEVFTCANEINEKKILSALKAMPKEDHLKYLQDVKWDLLYRVVDEITEEDIANWDIDVLKYLLKEVKFISNADNNIAEFPCKCVFGNSGTRRSELFAYALELFEEYINDNREKFLLDLEFHNTASMFILTFCKNSIESMDNKDIILELLAKCPTIFDVENLISPYLLLELVALYFRSDFNMKEVGRGLNKLLNQYIEKYGGTIIKEFNRRVYTLQRLRDAGRSDTVDLINGLLEDFNVNAAVLAMLILPLYSQYREDEKYHCSEYDEIFNTLNECQDPTVRFFLLRQETKAFV